MSASQKQPTLLLHWRPVVTWTSKFQMQGCCCSILTHMENACLWCTFGSIHKSCDNVAIMLLPTNSVCVTNILRLWPFRLVLTCEWGRPVTLQRWYSMQHLLSQQEIPLMTSLRSFPQGSFKHERFWNCEIKSLLSAIVNAKNINKW